MVVGVGILAGRQGGDGEVSDWHKFWFITFAKGIHLLPLDMLWDKILSFLLCFFFFYSYKSDQLSMDKVMNEKFKFLLADPGLACNLILWFLSFFIFCPLLMTLCFMKKWLEYQWWRPFIEGCLFTGSLNGILLAQKLFIWVFIICLTSKGAGKSELKGIFLSICPLTSFLFGTEQSFHWERSTGIMGCVRKTESWKTVIHCL